MRRFLKIFIALLGISLLSYSILTYVPNFISEVQGEKEFQDMQDKYTKTPSSSMGESREEEDKEDKGEREEEREEEGGEEINFYYGKEYAYYSQFYPCIDVDSESLYESNRDYIGWIYIPDTDISYPVCKSDDNNYYLHKNFEKTYRYSGTIFMDYRNDCADDYHSILYGHNMKNGSMFADIKNYLDGYFAQEHPVFWFITKDNHKLLFKVFSACDIGKNEKKYYKIYKDVIGNDFQTLTSDLKNASVLKNIDIDTNSKIMTLSTCMNNNEYRCIVSGVQITK